MTELLVQKLARLQKRLSPLNTRFGRPNFKTVVIEYPIGIYTVLGSAIEVTRIDSRQLDRFRNTDIKVNVDSLWLSGIARVDEYPIEMLQEGKYIIDAVRSPVTGLWSGKRADCIFLDTSNDTTYKVLVNRHRIR
jgi:hypothetical protein